MLLSKPVGVKEVLFLECNNIIKDFSDFFLDDFKQIKNKFPKINESEKHYRWMSIAINIQKRFEKSDDFAIMQFIQLFNTLEQLYSKDCRELLQENRNTVKRIANEIYLLSKEKDSVYDNLTSLANVQVVEQTDDVDEEQETIDGMEMDEHESDSKIILMIRTWFKRFAIVRKIPIYALLPDRSS